MHRARQRSCTCSCSLPPSGSRAAGSRAAAAVRPSRKSGETAGVESGPRKESGRWNQEDGRDGWGQERPTPPHLASHPQGRLRVWNPGPPAPTPLPPLPTRAAGGPRGGLAKPDLSAARTGRRRNRAAPPHGQGPSSITPGRECATAIFTPRPKLWSCFLGAHASTVCAHDEWAGITAPHVRGALLYRPRPARARRPARVRSYREQRVLDWDLRSAL